MTLTPEDLPAHTYLRENRPGWRSSLYRIRTQGGPWGCESCVTASMLSYRCSVCGADLAGTGSTAGERR